MSTLNTGSEVHEHYFVPASSPWPIVGAIGLGALAFGGAHLLHGEQMGLYFSIGGALTIIFMMFGWFRDVINESHKNLYSFQVDRSFRWGMYWFIFSEIMFFAAFFGALFYARHFSIPWMGGLSESHLSTHELLWPSFKAVWPLLQNPNPAKFIGPSAVIPVWGLPAINTVILVTSSITLFFAERGLKKAQRGTLISFLFITWLLAVVFLCLQAYEYIEAYHELNLTLSSGIYGTTFFMLTGFHGAHVTIGSIMLFVMLIRCIKGHFTAHKHFGLAAVSWYWHFVDVVWLFLFVLVYWL
jgi:cytochrome c oxidase subunit 3